MTEADVAPRRLRDRVARLAFVAAIALLAYAAAEASGVLAWLEPSTLAERVRASGPAGVILFVAAFCIGELTQVPGTVFFAAAVGVWGLPHGMAVGVVAAIAACTFSFAVVRLTGRWILQGRSLEAIRRYVPAVESAPLRTTILVRLLLGASPPVNWALALSAIGWRDFLVGTAIGLTPNVAVYVWLLDQLAFAAEPVLPAWAVVGLLLAVLGAAALAQRRLGRRERG